MWERDLWRTFCEIFPQESTYKRPSFVLHMGLDRISWTFPWRSTLRVISAFRQSVVLSVMPKQYLTCLSEWFFAENPTKYAVILMTTNLLQRWGLFGLLRANRYAIRANSRLFASTVVLSDQLTRSGLTKLTLSSAKGYEICNEICYQIRSCRDRATTYLHTWSSPIVFQDLVVTVWCTMLSTNHSFGFHTRISVYSFPSAR